MLALIVLAKFSLTHRDPVVESRHLVVFFHFPDEHVFKGRGAIPGTTSIIETEP